MARTIDNGQRATGDGQRDASSEQRAASNERQSTGDDLRTEGDVQMGVADLGCEQRAIDGLCYRDVPRQLLLGSHSPPEAA